MTDAVAAAVREAADTRTAVRLCGAGRWLRGGAPVAARRQLSVASDRGIVEYVPGDLTITARAGTLISELRDATRANDQWLPLDPWGGDDGTLGATISTATAGPHAAAMGLPRDVVLGMEFVTGTAEVVRSGGRVVKNVAGFDLTRLLVGSWGTLGVITEVTVRLRARPAMTRTIAIGVNPLPETLDALATRLRSLPFTPLAAEVLTEGLARQIGLGAGLTLIVRLGGNARSLGAQLDAMRAFGQLDDAPADAWQRLRVACDDVPAVWRVSDLPSRFGATWAAATRARAALTVNGHGSPLRGIVRVLADGPADALAAASAGAGNTTIPETLPSAAWASVAPRDASPVERAVKARFDPANVLNPGIMQGLA